MKAITFGSAMMDIIAVLESESIEQISFSNAHEQFLLVEPGRKVEANSISTHIGGGGLNSAVAFSRLGIDAMPIVKTGEDAARNEVLAHCEANRLRPDGLIIDAHHNTGSAVMIASHDKNAAIFTQRGANTCLVETDLEPYLPFDAELVHAAPLSGASARALPKIAGWAQEAGAFFSCNPGIRQITTRASSVLTASRSMSLISLNSVEAAALVSGISALQSDLEWQQPEYGERVLKSQGGDISLRQFCRVLHAAGPQNILVTLGADGACLFDGSNLHFQSVVEAKVAGTAGAGDSFVSTVAWALNSGRSPEQALKLAAHNASSVVSFVNTTDGLLEKAELEARAGL